MALSLNIYMPIARFAAVESIVGVGQDCCPAIANPDKPKFWVQGKMPNQHNANWSGLAKRPIFIFPQQQGRGGWVGGMQPGYGGYGFGGPPQGGFGMHPAGYGYHPSGGVAFQPSQVSFKLS